MSGNAASRGGPGQPTIDASKPFTANKKYARSKDGQPVWLEASCPDGNHHVLIGTENYFVSGDGYLMPAKKGQAPPNLKYFMQN